MVKNNLLSSLEGLGQLEAHRLLEQEGRKLERIARSVWRAYLSSYRPKVYARTGKSYEAIQLKAVKRLDSEFLGIELTWKNELVYHDSEMKNRQQGHAVMLISNGWRVKRGKHRDVYRFGYYEGFDYLGKVEKTYNAMKNPLVHLEIQWSGKFLK